MLTPRVFIKDFYCLNHLKSNTDTENEKTSDESPETAAKKQNKATLSSLFSSFMDTANLSHAGDGSFKRKLPNTQSSAKRHLKFDRDESSDSASHFHWDNDAVTDFERGMILNSVIPVVRINPKIRTL